ncbi:MAG: bifunctional biotin--[acetyl-CoA-carboxylase] ligase/biotin operon repressor BirA [Lonepinella koalarum]|nr:bifunctional biotin--[acetyl-CoA-carboxylase] ligase/biotin operon repressor BirA [Lonepinella koalarum]
MSILLSQLADCQAYSFEKLTALLNVDEEELLSQIQQLQNQGLKIDTSFGEVRLIPETELLNAVKLQRVFAPYKLIYQPIIDSTNRFLFANIGRLNKGDICVTEYQSAGRGRRGRQWQSPFASQIIFSFIWQVEARKPVEGLSLVVGMAIREALKEHGAEGIMLKWPNDILLRGRKLAGILIEIAGKENNKLNLVVGVGINVSIPRENTEIDQPWANLSESLSKIDRTFLLINIIKKIYQELEHFENQGITAEFQQRWLDADDLFGEQVNIITEKQIISGIEQGIDKRGYIQLINENGIQYFNGGEVSLRRK